MRNPLTSLGDYLDSELISRCLAEAGSVTLRKRRPPLEMMVWCIVGMAFERKEPLHQIVNRLDIMLPGSRPFVAPSAVIQARQRLGMVMRMLMTLQGASPGRIPELIRDLESMGRLAKLPTRRERAFPRVVKERPWKYTTAPKKGLSVVSLTGITTCEDVLSNIPHSVISRSTRYVTIVDSARVLQLRKVTISQIQNTVSRCYRFRSMGNQQHRKPQLAKRLAYLDLTLNIKVTGCFIQ